MSTPVRPHASRLLAAALVVLSTLGAACASGGKSAAPRGSQASHMNVLTADEIQRSHIANVYDVVSSLRPRWLQTRGVRRCSI